MNIVKQGNTLQFYNEIEILKELPVANYDLVWDPFGNCSLRQLDPFTFPEKLYDVKEKFRRQILSTFKSINKNVGVLLEGYKGQGKSVTAKLLCVESTIPVILITKPVPANVNFVSFLNDIKQDFVLFIDEFEKIFKDGDAGNMDVKMHVQNSFLSFMDGATSSRNKRLFLLTTNNSIGDKFINRPSRIRYYKKYEFMDESLFDSILKDKLQEKRHEEDLRQNLPMMDCTIDLLGTIIEEINIHSIPYSEFKDFFNHKPKKISYSRYILTDNKFEFKDMIQETREINRESQYINNSHQVQILKVEGPHIFYKAKEYEIDRDNPDNDKYVDHVYRLEKSAGPSYAF